MLYMICYIFIVYYILYIHISNYFSQWSSSHNPDLWKPQLQKQSSKKMMMWFISFPCSPAEIPAQRSWTGPSTASTDTTPGSAQTFPGWKTPPDKFPSCQGTVMKFIRLPAAHSGAVGIGSSSATGAASLLWNSPLPLFFLWSFQSSFLELSCSLFWLCKLLGLLSSVVSALFIRNWHGSVFALEKFPLSLQYFSALSHRCALVYFSVLNSLEFTAGDHLQT